MKVFAWTKLTIYFLICSTGKLTAQVDSSESQYTGVTLSAFLDVFYCYDFNNPAIGYRQPFLFNHNRHNQVNLNLGFVKASVEQKRYRANLAMQAGTYANDNYASEPGFLKHLLEANAGIRLGKKDNFWLDAGIFSSHIGFEGAVSIICGNLTRSLVAETSPYFLTGAKITFSPSEKWEFAGIISNGWQRIKRVARNSLPCFGTQVKFIPNEQTVLNWSTLSGTDDPDSTRRVRYFNNLYAQFKLNKRSALTLGFDAGLQQQARGSSEYHSWLGPVVIFRYDFTQKWSSAFRAEYYRDKNGVIITTANPAGFVTSGISFNADYRPVSNIACRLEGRYFASRHPVFALNGIYTDHNFFVTASVAVQFEYILSGRR